MFALTDEDMLRIWEIGLRQHPVERALTMLAVALPEVPRSAFLALSVGQRDTYLLSIHERTFGGRFAGYTVCPWCREQLEFTVDSAGPAGLRVGTVLLEETGKVWQFFIDGYELHTHLPNSLDLQALLKCQHLAEAREVLLQRCILQAFCAGAEVARDALPEAVIVAIGEYLVQYDPQSEVRLDFRCPDPACDHSWDAVFDIGTFLWTEILAHARRLLREIAALATTYGWREADILSMSTVRRQFYLEMIPT